MPTPTGYTTSAALTIANTNAGNGALTGATGSALGYTVEVTLTGSAARQVFANLLAFDTTNAYVNTANDATNFPSGYPKDLTVWSGGGTTQIDADVTCCTSACIVVAFKLQATLAAGATDTTTYVLAWGNASPTVLATLNNVNAWGDNFLGSSLNAAYSTAGVTAGVSNGYLELDTLASGTDPSFARITSTLLQSFNDYDARADVLIQLGESAWTKDGSRAGLDVRTNGQTGTGKGYGWLIHNGNVNGLGHGPQTFINDGVAWGTAYTDPDFSLGNVPASTWVTLREQIIGSGQPQGKIWTAGSAEPATWQANSTGFAALAGGPYYGISLIAPSNSTQTPGDLGINPRFRYFRVRQAVTAPPTVSAAVAYGPATTALYTGPASGGAGWPTTLTVTLDGTIASSETITPTVSGITGTFNPTTLTFAPAGSNVPASQTVQFTPTAIGSGTISATGSPALTGTAPSFAFTATRTVPVTFILNSATGNDTTAIPIAGGSVTWQTIAKLNATTFIPGDTIQLTDSQTFTGNLAIAQSGSAAAPIIVTTVSGGLATIRADGTGGSSSAQPAILVQNQQYHRYSNLVCVGPNPDMSGTAGSNTNVPQVAGIFLNSTNTTASGAKLSSVYLNRCTVYGFYSGILIQSTQGTNPVGWNDIRITSCTVHDTMNAGINSQAISTATNWNFTVRATAPWLTTSPFTNFFVSGCQVYNIYADASHNSGSGIVIGNVSGGSVERCVVHDIGFNLGSLDGGPGGIWMYSCIGFTFRYCETYRIKAAGTTDGIGLDIDMQCTNCVIEYCYSHDCEGTGYLTGNVGTGNIIRYCVSQNDGRKCDSTGFRWFPSASTCTVHNCTFYATARATGTTQLIAGSGNLPNTISIRDCILVITGSGARLDVNGAPQMTGNCYWLGGAAFSMAWNGTTYTSFAQFQADCENVGGVPTGLFADPKLANAGGAPTNGVLPTAQIDTITAYTLLAGSPCIDAGLDLLALFGIDHGKIDLRSYPNRVDGDGDGVAVYDIGACEYGGEALIPAGTATPSTTPVSRLSGQLGRL